MSELPLVDWNKTMVPRLGKIERCAEMVAYYSEQLAGVVESLPKMPKFDTRAEAALAAAHKSLTEALKIIADKPRED